MSTFAALLDGRLRAQGMRGRLAYEHMDAAGRAALEEWARQHGLNPARVPTEAMVDFDAVTGEWRIELYQERHGRMYLRDGTAARCVVRRKWKAPLPAGAVQDPSYPTVRVDNNVDGLSP